MSEPPKEPLRNRVIQELLATEKTYVHRLRTTAEVFIEPLRSGGILSPTELNDQFGCLEQIMNIHAVFLEDLAATPYDSVGNLMNNFCRGLTLYQPYLLIFEGALRKRAKLLLSNRRFNELVEAARLNPACENLSLESFLVGPVQRIPRYKLLLDELRKHTPEDHPDYPNIVAACETIKEVATENNEAFHIREAEEVIFKIMMQFDPKIDLLGDTKQRRLIREDDFQKQCRKGLKLYRFWLFNDILLYGTLNPSQRTYQLKHRLELCNTRITQGTESKFNGCDLIIQATQKSFYICTSSPEERDVWFKDYVSAIAKLQMEGEGPAVMSVAPIWRPDDQSGLCSRCNAEFSLLVRRHHCRNCGHIVCDNCSKDRMAIGNIDKGKPVRVCGPCKTLLSGSAPPLAAAAGGGLRRPSASAPPPVPPPNRKPPRPSVDSISEAAQHAGPTAAVPPSIPEKQDK